MGKINASIASVSTEFQPLPPDVYDFHIEAVEEQEKDGNVVAYRVKNVVTSAEENGKVYTAFCNIVDKDGNPNEMGIAELKKYFECIFGKEEVAGWTDDDFDTDMLVGKDWRGQLEIRSYTPKGSTETKQTNRVTRMEPIG